jgi:hypothetical protein
MSVASAMLSDLVEAAGASTFPLASLNQHPAVRSIDWKVTHLVVPISPLSCLLSMVEGWQVNLGF